MAASRHKIVLVKRLTPVEWQRFSVKFRHVFFYESPVLTGTAKRVVILKAPDALPSSDDVGETFIEDVPNRDMDEHTGQNIAVRCNVQGRMDAAATFIHPIRRECVAVENRVFLVRSF